MNEFVGPFYTRLVGGIVQPVDTRGAKLVLVIITWILTRRLWLHGYFLRIWLLGRRLGCQRGQRRHPTKLSPGVLLACFMGRANHESPKSRVVLNKVLQAVSPQDGAGPRGIPYLHVELWCAEISSYKFHISIPAIFLRWGLDQTQE
jgi:hypothetical protein